MSQQDQYVPSIGTEQIDALMNAMGPNAPTADEARAVIAYFENAWTAAGLLVAIEKGLSGLEQDGDDWYVTNPLGERIACFTPDQPEWAGQ